MYMRFPNFYICKHIEILNFNLNPRENTCIINIKIIIYIAILEHDIRILKNREFSIINIIAMALLPH